MVHTNVESRRMGMPRSMARSALSDTERTATPASVRVRNHPSPTSTTGTAMTMSRSSPVKTKGLDLDVGARQRRGDAADDGGAVEPAGHEELDAAEHLGQADGGDGEDEAGAR